MEPVKNDAPQAARKQVILSGIQPTGVFTLGNYIGAISNWSRMQEDYHCVYFIANMHAITVRQDPAKLKAQTLSAVALLMACGVDPKKSLLFIQSHVPAHAELAWVLSCYSQVGELSRMTQFKDKSEKHSDNVNVGLYTYPVLMAADILLYQADLVPVGDDQKQHLELSRDIAGRFNHYFGNVFKLPEPYIPKLGARVKSLADPTKKMSKSDENTNAFISILDPPETIVKKFKRAVTDSETEVRYAPEKAGINNLMTIYSAVTGQDFAAIERAFAGKGYGAFKLEVGETVAEHLRPVREEYARLMADPAYLKQVCAEGAEQAARLAARTLEKVYKKVGFLPRG